MYTCVYTDQMHTHHKQLSTHMYTYVCMYVCMYVYTPSNAHILSELTLTYTPLILYAPYYNLFTY